MCAEGVLPDCVCLAPDLPTPSNRCPAYGRELSPSIIRTSGPDTTTFERYAPSLVNKRAKAFLRDECLIMPAAYAANYALALEVRNHPLLNVVRLETGHSNRP